MIALKIYNPDLKKELVDELMMLDRDYFQLDKPVPFIKGLTLYPVNIKYYDEFLACTACLTLNRLEDSEGIMLNNIGYLIKKMTEQGIQGAVWAAQFSRLCELVFNITNGIRCTKCGKVHSHSLIMALTEEQRKDFHCDCGSQDFEGVIRCRNNPETKKPEIIVMGIPITSKDFDRLRQIVMYQNLPDFKDDSWVDPDVKEDQRAKQELLAKKNKGGNATLERKIVCVSAKTSYKIQELYELSIRKFLMLLSAVDDAMTYETTRIGLMTGMVSTKEPLQHWIYKSEDEDLYGAAVDAQVFKDSVSNA